MTTTMTIWNDFCAAHRIASNSTPLFAADKNRFVEVKEIGAKAKRKIMVRHRDMDDLIIRETDKLVEDWSRKAHEYDGLIYIMHQRGGDGSSIIPLYIGKTEKFGKKSGGNLSANICALGARKDKFARWGDNYAYHIGDLSAAVLPGHPIKKRRPKYCEWAKKLFKSVPADRPQLKFDVYFWAKAWKSSDVGIWPELSPIRLAFLEYLLIGVASTVFGETLLNYEGKNRVLVTLPTDR